MELTITLQPHTERTAFFGPNDRNLKVLRESYGIQIVARNGAVKLSGPSEPVGIVASVIERMQQLLLDRGQLDIADVHESMSLVAMERESSTQTTEESIPRIDVFARGTKILPKTPGQKEYIEAHRAPDRSWLSYPQSRLFASEQNTGNAGDWHIKAKFICESYDVATKMPELIAITHNHFQDNINLGSQSPSQYAMLPASVSKNLNDAYNFETFQAYRSTTPSIWGQTNEHYCCISFGLGCK